MAVMDTVKEAQDRSLETVKTVQEQVISFNERIADTVLGALPNYQSPFGEYLPKPAEVVDTYYAFVGEVYEANKEFAARIVQAWERPEDADA